MTELASMFPDLSADLLQDILRSNGGQLARAVDVLLNMQDGGSASSGAGANSAPTGDEQSARMEQMRQDELLAQMLQDELFMEQVQQQEPHLRDAVRHQQQQQQRPAASSTGEPESKGAIASLHCFLPLLSARS